MDPQHPITAAEPDASGLPSAEALLAGTLALMTGYAQACCDSRRTAMGRKIATNLQFLAQDTALTPHFRTMLGNLQARWQQQPGVAAGEDGDRNLDEAEIARTLWHRAPESLQ